jgi:hypothetical protein
VGFLGAALAGAMLRLLPREQGRGLDVAGAVLVTASVAALIYGLSQGQQHGFTAPATVAALAAAVILAVAFVVAERRVAAPMVPVRVLAGRARRAALGAMFLVAAGIVAAALAVVLLLLRGSRAPKR